MNSIKLLEIAKIAAIKAGEKIMKIKKYKLDLL